MKIKVRKYDMKSISEALLKDVDMDNVARKYTKSNMVFKEKYYIIEGPKGVVISYDDEGVHQILGSFKDKMELNVNKKVNEDTISIYPMGSVKYTITDILKMAPKYEETDVKDMVRVFGSRLNRNYNLLLGSLRKIGLNLDDYNINRNMGR